MANARKTPVKTPVLTAQPHGGAIRTGGNPGNRGGGRPANKFREWCADLLAKPEVEAQVEEILTDKSHPAHATMWKALADRAYGKPVAVVETTVNNTTPAPVNPDELRVIYTLVLGRGMNVPQAENYIRTHPEEVKEWLARHAAKKAE